MAVAGGSSRRYDPEDDEDQGFWSSLGDFFSGDVFPEGSVGARLAGRGPSVGAELRSQIRRPWDAMTDWASGHSQRAREGGVVGSAIGDAYSQIAENWRHGDWRGDLAQSLSGTTDPLAGSNVPPPPEPTGPSWGDTFRGLPAEDSIWNMLFGDDGGGQRTTGANDVRAQNPLGGQHAAEPTPQRPEAPSATDYLGPPPSAGSAAAPQVSTGPYAGIEQAQSRAAAQLTALDDQYEERLAELRERYEFAETPEEKAQIQFLLGDLEQRRDAGKQAIEQVYDEAIASSVERAGGMREDAQETGEQVGELYRQAAEDTSQIFADMNEEQDSAYGVGGEQMSETAQDWVGVMQAAAPREQAYAQQTGEIAARDVEHLGEAMNEQQAARAAALERLAMQMQTAAQMQHDQRVQDRINQERMRFSDQAQALRGMFDQRGFGLQDRISDLDVQGAGMAQDARMANARMAQDASIANQRAQNAYQQRRQEAAMQEAEQQYHQDMMEWLRQERQSVIQDIMRRDDIDSLDEAIALAQMQYPELFE